MGLSIDITLDKYGLAGEISDYLIHYKPWGLQTRGYGGTSTCKFYKGWWLCNATANYPKHVAWPPWVPFGLLGQYQKLIIGAVYYVPQLFDAYLLFIERAPGDAYSNYHGFYLSSTGTLEAKSYPGTLSGTTSTTISAGDIIALMLDISNPDGNIYVRFGAAKIDWDTDTVTTEIVSAYTNVGAAGSLEPYRYLCWFEPNGVAGKIAWTAMIMQWDKQTTAPTGGLGGGLVANVLIDMKQYGLADPRMLSW